ncbi:hypothetical protein FACS1894151_03890 [Spirochaetia bacterium]|nr:hypothetical protein FACS1894151_03890 [Spirochaetia bacterium]
MTIDDLVVTAGLAHLNLDKAELEAAFPAFEQMLEFFAAMQAADTDEAAFTAVKKGAEPVVAAAPSDSFTTAPASPGIAGNIASAQTVDSLFFRRDNPENPVYNENSGLASSVNENLLNKAGERDGRFIVIPNVL